MRRFEYTLSYCECLFPTHSHTTEAAHVIVFSGSASVSDYQQALSAVGYINRAPEPSPSTRSVLYTVSDGIFTSNTATASLTLALINDNMLMLSCGAGVVNFMEGSQDPVPVASQLTLVDLDADHMITGASVDIGAPQEGDEISLDSSVTTDLDIVFQSATSVQVSGIAADNNYQVQL